MTKILGNLFIDGESVIEDETGTHLITINGNTTISTTEKKFGNSSIYFDGNGDYLSVPTHVDFGFGLGDFTIDLFINRSITGEEFFLSARTSNDAQPWILYFNASNYLVIYDGVTQRTGNQTIITDGWHHIAIVRSSGTLKMYVDGVQCFSGTVVHDFWSTRPLRIGGSTIGVFTGYMDNVRIVKGQALWTSNFELTEEALFYKDAIIPSSYVRPDNIRGLYDSTLKAGIRNAAKNGFVRPTLSEMFMTHKDFVEVPSLFIPTYNWDTVINNSYTYNTGTINATKSVSNWTSARLNAPLPNSGKYYWEIDSFGAVQAGLATDDFPYASWDIWYSPLKGSKCFSYFYNVNESGRRIMVAVDVDAKKLWFGSGGIMSGNPAVGFNPDYTIGTDPLYPTVSIYHAAASSQATWGTAHFTKFLLTADSQMYAPPADFVPLN